MAQLNRLRVAQITFACHRRGGIERVVYELSKRLAGDHEVHIFAGSCELVAEGMTFHKLPVVPWPWVANHLGFFVATRWALRRAEADAPFDIVHVQGIPAAVASDVTTAHSVHCVGTDRQRALLPPMRRAWQYAKTADPVMRRMTSHNFRPGRCRRVIAISEQVKRDVVRSFGVAPANVEVIHNGVDVDAFSPARRGKARPAVRSRLGVYADATVALFVANEFQRKGLDLLLRGLARLEGADRPYLVVVGDTRDSVLTLADCQRLCRQMGIDRWVRFVGAVGGIEDFYAAADFFVLPTAYEPFGLVILEALASGLPVVFSRLAGAADIVENGREAFLIDNPRDPDEIAARMLPLARDSALRTRMGVAARQTALRYSWDRVTARTVACYETVLSQRGRVGRQRRMAS